MDTRPLWIGAALVGGAVATGAYATLIERNHYRLRQVTVPVLPPHCSPVTVLHLSDLHLTPLQWRKAAWIRGLARWAPDAIINTGDNVAHAWAIPLLARALEPFAGIPGVFVGGSNDLYAPGPVNPLGYFRARTFQPRSIDLPTAELWAQLEAYGWVNAEERSVRLTLRELRLLVRGCGDAHLNRDYYTTVAGPRPADTDLLVGVTHAPYRRVLNAMTADGCELILAGHTHGGQVCLPSGRALTTNCDLPTEQARGLSTWSYGNHQAYLHVSAGLGTSPYAPYRLFCPPDATLLRLTPRTRP